MDIFNQNKLLFKGKTSNLSESDIKNSLPKDFIGFKDFMELYLVYDGIDFMRNAKMFRSKFYDAIKNELNEIDVSFFFNLTDIISEKKNFNDMDIASEYKSFAETHIPFADNGCGNSIWIDIDTGIIKRFDSEEEFSEAIKPIAPNFRDFCLSLEDLDPNWIKPIYSNLE